MIGFATDSRGTFAHSPRMSTPFLTDEPKREQIDASSGPVLLEFGSPTCGWCRAAQPKIEAALGQHAQVRHLKVADGPGRPLGRSFRVKLWPTLVFLRDGVEQERLIRPDDETAIRQGLERIDPA